MPLWPLPSALYVLCYALILLVQTISCSNRAVQHHHKDWSVLPLHRLSHCFQTASKQAASSSSRDQPDPPTQSLLSRSHDVIKVARSRHCSGCDLMWAAFVLCELDLAIIVNAVIKFGMYHLWIVSLLRNLFSGMPKHHYTKELAIVSHTRHRGGSLLCSEVRLVKQVKFVNLNIAFKQ